MEEDMEVEGEEGIEVYDVVEVDLDYEYDAVRYFDFTRPESEAEARLSEDWFESAPSYPPSPFVTILFQEEGLYSQNVAVLPKSKYGDGDTDIDQRTGYCDEDEPYRDERIGGALLQNARGSNVPKSQNKAGGFIGGTTGFSTGFSFYNHFASDPKKAKAKSLAKPFMPRSSTLMKPTTSQLAKQNQRTRVCNPKFQKNEAISSAHSGVETQASKRQKLDGGLLRRIVDTNQPISLIHKIPHKGGAVQGINSQAKLRITIPREPDLETAHRAERMRSTSNKEVEDHMSRTCRFKARSLNRKNREAPVHSIPKRSTPHLHDFQAVRLKTGPTATSLGESEKAFIKFRATSMVDTGNKDGKRCEPVAAPKLADCNVARNFKARPLDRKILTSRGDLGLFRNSKRDVTVPKEFQFQTAKRNQQNPPIDLFSKLSLAGEPQPKSSSQLHMPQRTRASSKGSKENRWESCQQDQNLKLLARETQNLCSGKPIPHVPHGGVVAGPLGNGTSRAFGIWRQ